MDFIQRVGTNHLKICVESEKTSNGQGKSSKENHSWGHHNSRFQVVLQRCGHQDSVVLTQKQTHRSMEQNPEVDPQLYGQLIFDKAGKTIHWKRTVFPASSNIS